MAKELKDFRQGDTKIIRIDYGTGVDITGFKFWFSLRKEFDDTTPVSQTSTTAGNHSLDDVANGLAYIQLESDDSSLIPVDKYYWDVQAADTSSPPIVTTLLPTVKLVKDKIAVLEQVTKTVIV